MMNYKEFLNTIRSELKLRTNPGTQILVQEVEKDNGLTVDTLSILPTGKEISPSIHIKEYYEEYQNGKSIKEVIDDILELYRIHMIDPPFDISRFQDFEKVRPTLVYKLIHYERNQKLLKKVPHRPFLDLAIVCYFMVDDEALGMGTVMVYNEYLSLWKISEDQLFAVAKEKESDFCADLPLEQEP